MIETARSIKPSPVQELYKWSQVVLYIPGGVIPGTGVVGLLRKRQLASKMCSQWHSLQDQNKWSLLFMSDKCEFLQLNIRGKHNIFSFMSCIFSAAKCSVAVSLLYEVLEDSTRRKIETTNWLERESFQHVTIQVLFKHTSREPHLYVPLYHFYTVCTSETVLGDEW